MLKVLRHRKTAKKIWIGLALIIIPAFALWGFGGAFSSREESMPKGKIFGRAISSLEIKDSLSAVTTIATMQYGDKLPEIQKSLNLEAQAWQRLVLLEEAKRRSIKTNDQEVVKLIKDFPYFKYKDSFDKRTYEQTLQYVFRLKPREFEEQMRQYLILNKLFKQVTEGVTIDEKVAEQEYEKANQEISIYYIASLIADYAKKIKPNEKDLNTYFNANREAFGKPALLNIEYLKIESSAQTKKVSELLDKKATLEEISKKLGIKTNETGFFEQANPPKELNWPSTVFSLAYQLKPGERSPLLQIENTGYLLRLKEKKNAALPEFSAVKQRVKEAFINKEALKMAEQKINSCAQELKSQKFNQAARKCGLTAKETLPFKYGTEIKGIGSSDIFWNTAKSLKAGQASPVLKTPAGFYLIQLKSISGIDKEKYRKEKTELTEKLLNQKKQEKLQEFIIELNKKAQ